MNAVLEQDRGTPKNLKTIHNVVSLNSDSYLVLHTTFLSILVKFLLGRLDNTRNIYPNVNLGWLHDPGQT